MRVRVYHASRIFPSLSISRLPIFPPDKFIPNFKLSRTVAHEEEDETESGCIFQEQLSFLS